MARRAKGNLESERLLALLLGGRIRRERLRRGLSQQDVSRRCGVPQRTISEWESGAHDPSFLGICKVAVALGVRIDALTPEPTDRPHRPRKGRPSKVEIEDAAST